VEEHRWRGPSHPAEHPLADRLGDVSCGRRGTAIESLRRGATLREKLEHIVDAQGTGIDGGHGLGDLIEEVAVAPSRLTELPLSGQGTRAGVPPSERAAVTRLIGRERRLGDGRRTEPGPESERVSRDGAA